MLLNFDYKEKKNPIHIRAALNSTIDAKSSCIKHRLHTTVPGGNFNSHLIHIVRSLWAISFGKSPYWTRYQPVTFTNDNSILHSRAKNEQVLYSSPITYSWGIAYLIWTEFFNLLLLACLGLVDPFRHCQCVLFHYKCQSLWKWIHDILCLAQLSLKQTIKKSLIYHIIGRTSKGNDRKCGQAG